jgi:predicted ArsR family transcriptional regulator
MAPRRTRQSEPKADIRRRILQFIKSRGRASIEDVAAHFRIGHEGARKQVLQMEAFGWLDRPAPAEPAGKGRPKAAYAVSLAGEQIFPKAYDRLSIALFSALAEQGDAGVVKKVLASLADRQVAAWAPLLAGKSAKDKLKALRGLYQEDDPFMSVEERDGQLILVERNCPFLSVALAHPSLCSLSVMTLERLLGHPVVREERFQAGHGRCVFRVRTESGAPEAGFRLEAERERPSSAS